MHCYSTELKRSVDAFLYLTTNNWNMIILKNLYSLDIIIIIICFCFYRFSFFKVFNPCPLFFSIYLFFYVFWKTGFMKYCSIIGLHQCSLMAYRNMQVIGYLVIFWTFICLWIYDKMRINFFKINTENYLWICVLRLAKWVGGLISKEGGCKVRTFGGAIIVPFGFRLWA